MFCLHGLLRGQELECFIQQPHGAGRGRRRDAVMHPSAFAAGSDESGGAEVGEMARDLGLLLGEHIDKIADADFIVAHEIEQTQTGWIGERLEEAGQIIGGCGVGHGEIISGLTDVYGFHTFG